MTRVTLAIAALAFFFGFGCRAEPPAAVRQSAPEHATNTHSPATHRVESNARWGALRVYRVGSGAGPVVVLLHGFGAPGDDLVQFARALDVRGARFVLPEAPIVLPHGGRAWWPLDERELVRARMTGHPEDLGDRHPAGLVAARKAVLSVMRAASERFGVPESRLIIGGFSQGAITALDVALHAPEPPAAVAVMSGAPIALDDSSPRFSRLAGVPVLISHGRSDPLLSFDAARRLADALRRAGAAVEWVPFDGGHAIPASVRVRLAALIEKVGAEATGNVRASPGL